MIDSSSISFAQKILNHIKNDKRSNEINIILNVFRNGHKEQGYLLYNVDEKAITKSISFCQKEYTFCYVVYHSNIYEKGNYGSHSYSNEFLNNGKLFELSEIYEVVDYIFDLLGVKE